MGVPGFVLVVVAVMLSIPAALTFAGPLVMGKNGYSLSKLQLLLWTLVVATSYLIYVWVLQRHAQVDFTITASANLLLLLGLSAGSFVAASGIRAYQYQKGALLERPAADRVKWITLISDNSGSLDLSKVQMLIWTVVALSAYIVQLAHDLPQLDYMKPALPEVSEMLLALMGVSQAAYIGRKAVPETATSSSSSTPGATSSPDASAATGTEGTGSSPSAEGA